ncbi:phosphoesterase [Paenibacillus sp. J31TS4]|uniref:metallophosphoesterase family protein n=1 Tax=Paenibacillus sp. J31TS4 TaxID=2807195 RepID=UPI001B139312|nr:metallophosphoesterase family protein [Paenibacillus sp. J31TS4]GIP36901.1 phosphoesterase [Paenibacillus sp. J31TS4]
MKIGVLSDTHMPRYGRTLPRPVYEAFEGVDLILHAGDWQTLDVYDELAAIAPVEGVTGNTDGWELYDRFGAKKLLELGGFRIGLVHGHEGRARTTEGRAQEAFRDEQPDAIVFGHSHIPMNRTEEGILLFNPGSPTDKRRQPRYSCGILELGTELKARHIYFDKEEN